MTDNFDLFEKYIRDAGIPESKNYLNDKFFTILLIRRGKDCPDLPAANYTFKIYYIDNLDQVSVNSYYTCRDEIKLLCKHLPLRAYISVNCKSKSRAQVRVLNKIAQAIEMNETKKPWRMFATSCDEIEDKNDKRWVLDIDSKDKRFIDPIRKMMLACSSKYKLEDRIILEVPTKSGIHIITRPFNTFEFDKRFEEMRPQLIVQAEKPDIKKNHLTLLYEDLEEEA